MPLMTRIRESMTKIFAVFAGVFVVYIVLDWGMDLGGRQDALRSADAQVIGYIDGEGIQYRDFANIVQQSIDNQRAQTGVEPEEMQIRLIRDQVWSSLVTERLYDAQAERLGLTVTDQEVIDAVRGDNPPVFLRNQFTDSLGNFNRQAYDAALSDPRNKAVMVTLEQAIRQQRLREKLQSVVLASVTVSEGEIARKFADDNTVYDAEYLSFDPNVLVPDTTVEVTDDELRAYYDDHLRDYKVEATRKLKYVNFVLASSKNDTDDVRAEIEDILRRVGEGADFAELAEASSATPATDAFFRHGELQTELEKAVFAAKAGDVVGPVLEQDGFHLVKVLEFRAGSEPFVHAQHVLIRTEGTDDAAALEKARTVLARAKAGEDIGALAAEFSDEPGADTRRGDLGWFGRDRMVKPFSDAVFAAKPGQIIGPVKTDFGYHVVKIHGRDNREVKVRDLHLPVTMSPKTAGDVYQRAQDFAYFARENGLEKEAETNGLRVVETPAFTRDGSIPGLAGNKGINRFAFEGDVGDVSDALSTGNGYVVCVITEEKRAGVRPFDEVKASITTIVRREKKTAKTAEIAAAALAKLGPGDSLRSAAGSAAGIRADRVPDLRVTTVAARAVRDPAFTGALEALSPGETSKPVPGARGVYVIRVHARTPFDSAAYKVQRGTIFSQLLQQKRDRHFTDWTAKLRETAVIEDKRDLFFR